MATHIAGTVTDAEGTPLVGVVVRAHRRDTGALLSDAISGVTTERWTSTGSTSSWNNETGRVVVNSTLVPSATHFRLTLSAGTGSCAVNKMYIGEAATTGDAYDFATTPVQVTFAGLTTVSIPANGSTVSDLITLTTDGTKNIVISYYIASGQTAAISAGSLLNWNSYYITGDNAAAVDATTGYTVAGNDYLITRVDMYRATADGAYDVPCGTYTGEVQVVFLDPDDATLQNDVIHRSFPATV